MSDETWSHEKWRGVEYRFKRMSLGPKEPISVNSPRSSMRKKKAEIRANQRDAKREDRVPNLISEIDDHSFVIGSQDGRKGSDVLTFPTPRPLFCLSTSCISDKDVTEAIDHTKLSARANKAKKKQRQKFQKPSRSDQNRSRYIQRLKQVITAGNNGQDRVESERRVDTKQQGYSLRRTEIIWLELQAWFNDHSLFDQDQILFNARQSLVMDVLKFISVFHYQPKYIKHIAELKARIESTLQQLPDGACHSCGVNENFEDTEGKHGAWHGEVHSTTENGIENFSPMQLSDSAEPLDKSDAKSHPCLTLPSDEYLLTLKHALKNVDQLLKLLCITENLYPSSNLLANDYPYYSCTEFQAKIKAVCSWYNITTDLRRKFVSFMQILHLSSSCSERSVNLETNGQAINESEAEFHSNVCGININQLISHFTNRNLKQRSVKNILHSFLQRMFSGLLRAKMNMMPESCYGPSELGAAETSNPAVVSYCKDVPKDVNELNNSEDENPIPQSLCSKLTPSVRKEQRKALRILMEKIENVLSTTPCKISKLALEEIMEDASAISSLDQPDAIFGLPSLKPLYLLLANTIFQIMRQCMHLRMKEAMPFFNSSGSSVSLLTLKQLVLESKEILECGLLTRDIMRFFISNFFADDDPNRSITLAFSTYEEDLRSMVNTYLDFVKTWLTRIQRDLPLVPRSFQEILEQEWVFACSLLPQLDFDCIISCMRHFLELSADISGLTREFLSAAVGELVHSQLDTPAENHTSSADAEAIQHERKISPAVGRAGVLWFHRQRSESPHLSRHSSSQSADSFTQPESPVEFGRQVSSATDSSSSSMHGITCPSTIPWMTYRSTSYLGYQKRYLFEVCRAVRDLFNETRERATKILHFGKRLRKTLEPAIGYDVVENTPYGLQDGICSHCHLFDALRCEGYALVDLSEYIRQKINALDAESGCELVDLENFWIFMPDPASTTDNVEMVPNGNEIKFSSTDLLPMIESILYRHLSYASYGDRADPKGEFLQRRVIFIKKTIEHSENRRQSDVGFRAERKTKARGSKTAGAWRKTKSESNFHIKQEDCANHMRRCIQGDDCTIWNGNTITACVDSEQYSDNVHLLCHRLDLSHDVTVVLESAEDVGIVRKEITSMITPHAKLAIAQMPIVKGIKDVFDSLRQQILQLCGSLINSIELILNYLDEQSDKILQHGVTRSESTDMDLKRQVRSEVNEVMQSCFNFGFDLVKEATRIMSADFHDSISKIHLSLISDWMRYVLKYRCRGKGYRPRWASQGLAFLVSLDFGYMLKLSEEEFQALKKTIDSFLSHLIGSSNKSTNDGRDTPTCSESKSFGTLQIPEPEVKMLRSLSNSSVAETTPKSPISYDDGASNSGMDGEDDDLTPVERIRYAVDRLEFYSDRRRFDSGTIGCVSNAPKKNSIANLGVRTVSFRWQRGARVGEGAFGKVYTCVNVDTGNILAMKEVKFHPNDHQKIRSAIDEYTNFEGIQHPNLVRYYGVELHRDEMYIFMEYCDGGTLGDICKISLPEEMVRSYTSQILAAVHTLHSRGIVHRDIKGSNIFLTSSGTIKLGDFGSAIKLRDVMKTIPGEMVTHIGTTLPYTAPEVINASASVGYGRASDIWSLGCVVIEMSSGKQPWHDLDRVQLMFKVGSGYPPPIPESLSEEGKNFVSVCSIPNPAARWSAEKLLGHAFAKVSGAGE